MKLNAWLPVALTLALAAGPVAAQQSQDGLVNVQVGDIKTGDIVSNNTVEVGVAANVAATVCGTTVNAAVISEQIAKTGSFLCQGATQFARITQSR